MRVPFFAPSPCGPLAAVAHLPPDTRGGLPVLLLSGGRAGRHMLTSIADELALRGAACLRFDYPGTGATPQADTATEAELVDLSHGVASWWRQELGARALSVVGTCLGARITLEVAARDPAVETVVGVYMPFEDRRFKAQLQDRIRALDARGPHLAARFLPATRVLDRARSHADDAVERFRSNLSAVGPATRLRFLYGAQDRSYQAFSAALSDLPAEIAAKVEVEVLAGSELHGIPDAENTGWIRRQVVSTIFP